MPGYVNDDTGKPKVNDIKDINDHNDLKNLSLWSLISFMSFALGFSRTILQLSVGITLYTINQDFAKLILFIGINFMSKEQNKSAKARIIGLGSYLPERILTNSDLEKMVETSDEWIVSRTGIRERHIAAKDEFTSTMGAKAAEEALKNGGCSPSDIDLIIVVTLSPDYITPSTAGLIQSTLKATQAAAFDLQAACSGFIYGLSAAKAYVDSGMFRTVLLIASEKMSAYVDYTDRNTCVLFGDGSSAAVISSEGNGLIIDSVVLGSEGDLAPLLMIPAGGVRQLPSAETIEKKLHSFQMEGKEVFKHAVRRMTAAAKECLQKANVAEERVTWLIPHQANLRIIDAVGKNFSIPDEKIFKVVHKYGNTSAASIPLALCELLSNQEIQNGDHLLLVAFGAGLTWGAALLTQEMTQEITQEGI